MRSKTLKKEFKSKRILFRFGQKLVSVKRGFDSLCVLGGSAFSLFLSFLLIPSKKGFKSVKIW